MLISHIFTTPVGNIEIAFDEHFIYKSCFTDANQLESLPLPNTSHFQTISQQLNCYFKDCNHMFALQYHFEGSPHQIKVWQALATIPPGQVKTYGELARELNSCAQAIGQACKRNPIALFIPCHRVIGKNNYGGFMGAAKALKFKLELLKHERYLT